MIRLKLNALLVFMILTFGHLLLNFQMASAAPTCLKSLIQDELNLNTLTLKDYAQHYARLVPAVQQMINLGIQRYSKKPPKGYCYRAVKELLLDSGMVRRALDGTWARSAHSRNFLAHRGFINLLTRVPFRDEIRGALDEHIPFGAILVFDGANGEEESLVSLGEGIGHIEIKCGPNCYISDTLNTWPGGPSNGIFYEPNQMEAGEGKERRRLTGVYILDYFSLF